MKTAIFVLPVLSFTAAGLSLGPAPVAGILGLVIGSHSASPHDGESPGRRPVRELFAPESWAGQWDFRFEYRNPDTDKLIATEQAIEVICPGDRFGLSSYVPKRRHRDGDADDDDENDGVGGTDLQAGCEGLARDDLLELACASRFTHGNCRIDFRLEVDVEHQPDTISGSGEWRVTETAGDCEQVLRNSSLGEIVQISGVRIGTDLAACSAPPESLVEKLLSQPELITVLPPPIADLAVRADHRTVRLSWTAVPNAAVYKIYRARLDERFDLIARRRAHHGPHFRDHRIRKGLTYRYVVRWVDADGRESPASNEASASPPPVTR